MSDTSELQLKLWFGYLKSFQACAAKINTDLASLSLLAFANAKPATYLVDAVGQNQFAVSAYDKTSIPIQASDVSGAASFVALLGSTFGVANRYIAAYMRFLAPAPFSSMTVGDFQLQKTSAVFPKGATDPVWLKMNAAQAQIIDPSCYSTAQQAAVAAVAANNTKLISDVVNQIAKLG
jgi:hypothetical protein